MESFTIEKIFEMTILKNSLECNFSDEEISLIMETLSECNKLDSNSWLNTYHNQPEEVRELIDSWEPRN